MIELGIGEVHIWTARSSGRMEDRPAFERVLNDSETAAANRFRFERHRLNYIFSHAVLRTILSSYLDRRPQDLQFRQNSFGKPFLVEAGAEPLEFNMSHSGDVVAVGLTRRRLIGVDIELIRPIDDFASIARLNFTFEEYAFIENAPAERREYAFFRCWSRKEAVIKAVGKGVSMPLNSFSACIPRGEKGRRLSLPADAPGIDSWWLADLTVPEGYVGAVAVEHGISRLAYMVWESGSESSTV